MLSFLHALPSLTSAYHHTVLRSSMAIVSIVASCILIWMIMRCRPRLSTTYHRLLFGLSISDIVFSFSLAHFNMMIPVDDSYFVWNARGTVGTCSAHGFIIYLGACGGLLYSCR